MSREVRTKLGVCLWNVSWSWSAREKPVLPMMTRQAVRSPEPGVSQWQIPEPLNLCIQHHSPALKQPVAASGGGGKNEPLKRRCGHHPEQWQVSRDLPTKHTGSNIIALGQPLETKMHGCLTLQ